MLLNYEYEYLAGTHTYSFSSISVSLIFYPATFIFPNTPSGLNLYLVDLIGPKEKKGPKNVGYSICRILEDFITQNTDTAIGYYPLQAYKGSRDRLFNKTWLPKFVSNSDNLETIRHEIDYEGINMLIFQAYHHVDYSNKYLLMEEIEIIVDEYRNKPE